MGFEKTEDKDRSAVEGFETDVVDLDNGKLEDIKSVKAPRRSSRREPRFGAKRDRLGRKETNTDDTPDNDGMVAPMRPVRLSGQGSGTAHIQKPLMREGSDFAYLFTDQDEDQNDRHMDRAKASRLDGLAYDEKTDGDGDIYAELFAKPQAGLGEDKPRQAESAGREPVRNESRERQEPPAAGPENNNPAGREPSGAGNGGANRTGRRATFRRHTASSAEPGAHSAEPAPPQRDAADRGYGRPGDAPPYPGREYPEDQRDYGRRPDRYGVEYDRMRGYDDRYGREYPPYDYDYYDREREEYRRHGYYRDDREREYEGEPPYPPYPYQRDYMGVYPAPPVYYPGSPVPYVQAPVYGVPVQGIPYQGVPVQGMPVQGVQMQGITVQGMPYPVPNGYSYVYTPVQNGEAAPNAGSGVPGQQPGQNANDSVGLVPNGQAPADTDEAPPVQNGKETDAADAYQETVVPERKTPAEGTTSGSSRFNRHGGAQSRPDAAETAAHEESAPVPGENDIPHFRPRSHSQRSAAPEQHGLSGERSRADAAESPQGTAQSEAKPSDSRFRRRHSGES